MENANFMTPAGKQYTDTGDAQAQRTAQNTQGALRNRAFSSGSATQPTAPTAASPLFVMAAKLTARVSGIFRVAVYVASGGLTAADTWDIQVSTQTAANLAITNATLVGPGTAGLGTGTAAGAYVSSAAAGILVTGGPLGSLLQADSGTTIVDATSVSFVFTWAGIVHNSIAATVPTPFTIGNDVIVLVAINRSAHTQTFPTGGTSIAFEELI